MVREIKDANLLDKVKSFSKTPFFIPVLFLLFLVLTIPVITLVTQKSTDLEQRAAQEGLTATINVEPGTGTVAPGDTFTADLVIDGGGQEFNAAQATIAVTGDITVQSLNVLPPEQGGCNLTFANESVTPTINNLSFAGAILNGSSQKCTLYTVTLLAEQEGGGGITISDAQVKSYVDNSEIFLSSQNGVFTISTQTTPPIPQTDMYLNPSQGTFETGDSFTVEVRLNTNGQTVNAVETDITYPTALVEVVSIDDTNADFNVPAEETFSNGTISIAYGAITPVSGDVLVTKINFTAIGAGTVNLSFLNSVVLDSATNSDVLQNATGGVYTVSAPPTTAPSPTPTAVPTTTPQPTTEPTSTPVPPTATSAPTATPVSGPSFTLNTVPGATYRSIYTLSGTKSSNASAIFINNNSTGVEFPSSTLWQADVQLLVGQNAFAIYAQDSNGNKSNTVNISISRHRVGDITGDDIIDLTDLSIFGSDWAKSGSFNNALSDMNEDGNVNLTDFSIFAKAYGN